ncbi:hypothetical protein WI40_31940 [Burkholderia ubonensis]|uniref:hypothetical protein n=1 Tax=Burkholderia ubonensis TaxID=101571 RepID=UPI0007545BEE|nr:hypothetical protein [Burkholderia ubonensis]KUZ86104.1 hypothetical protein WI40_31940 [Burkholderia ubonensis]
MPIRILHTPAPLSLEARKKRVSARTEGASSQAPDLQAGSLHLTAAKSEASRILEWELGRYCKGQIQGRSFLIAGHRGSGKTSMVNEVIELMLRESLAGKLPLRPLLVLLHGPSLFDTSDDAGEKDKREGEENTAAAGSAPPPQGAGAANGEKEKASRAQARNALMQIILGLHRAVVKEYAEAYYESAARHAAVTAQAGGRHGRLTAHDAHEWSELAAQFEVELAEDPRALRLRQFYSYIGALEHGILNRHATGSATPASPDQGARELVALNGICTAHQRISGKLSEQENSLENETQVRQSHSGLSLADTDTLKQIAALVSGAAVTGGAAAGAHSLWQSALFGAVTVLVASVALKYSLTSVSKSERTVDRVFIPDLSLGTLDRLLPTLLDRLMSAGLAPVLVIDELDKVKGLSTRLGDMVSHLKKLLAENAFSCFLTDRGYLEYRELDERKIAYGPAYSYFSHSLLVAYQPADLDIYLQKLLRETDEIGERLDLEVLKWVLRHRSCMHAMALHREIAALSKLDDPSGPQGDPVIALPEGTIRSKTAYRIDTTLQVAIEYHLNARMVIGWLTQYPNKRQTLVDALYYISRQWRNGEGLLNLDDACLGCFRADLEQRMNLEETLAPGTPAFSLAEYSLSDGDLQILFGIVRELAHDLCDTGSNRFRREQWLQDPSAPTESLVPIPQQAVLDAMLLDQKSVLIEYPGPAPASPGPAPGGAPPPVAPVRTYRFRYWQSGEVRDWAEYDRLRASAGSAELPKAPTTPKTASELADEAAPRIDYINAFERALWPMFETAPAPADPNGVVFLLLSDQLRVLPTTPAWAHVQSAKDRLGRARYGQGNVSQLVEDLRAVAEFETTLARSVDDLRVIVPTAAFVCGLGGEADRVRALRRGLEVLAKGLKFAQTDLEGVRRGCAQFLVDLNNKVFGGELSALAAKDEKNPDVASFRLPDFEQLVTIRHEEGLSMSSKLSWPPLVAQAWGGFLRRFSGPTTVESEFPAYFDEILCAAAKLGPGEVLGLNVASLTLRDWTRALIEAVNSTDEVTARFVPADIIPLALQNLGSNAVRPDTSLMLHEAIMKLRRARSPQAVSAVTWPLPAATNPPPLGDLAHTRIVIVIVDTVASASSGWTRTPTRGLFFAMETRDMELVMQWLPELPSPLPEPIKVVWERDPGDAVRHASQTRWLQSSQTDRQKPGGRSPLEFPAVTLLQSLPPMSSPDYPDELIASLYATVTSKPPPVAS